MGYTVYLYLVAQMFEEPIEGTVELITIATSRLPVQNLREFIIYLPWVLCLSVCDSVCVSHLRNALLFF